MPFIAGVRSGLVTDAVCSDVSPKALHLEVGLGPQARAACEDIMHMERRVK